MRRLITLALVGLLLWAPALAQETDDTVQRRHADAVTAYEAASETYRAEIAAYIAAVSKPVVIERRIEVREEIPVPVVATDDFEERMGFALTYRDDGGCSVPFRALTGSYDREAGNYDAHASVTTAPSGGDCERNSTSFHVSLERRYEVGNGWAAVGKFLADRRSTTAPYALVDAAGVVLARPDGNPSDPVTLPAGAADTIGGYLGISTPEFEGFRATIAGNVVPVDWAEHESGLALHMAVSYDFRDTFDVDAHIDAGADSYGQVRGSWRPSVASRIGAEVSASYAFGLNAVDSGAPAMQTFAGLPVTLQGAPRDDSLTVSIGITF